MVDRAGALRGGGWLLLALLPSLIAVAQLGRIHPDEVYQYLEPAYARVHGYGVLAWEWREGLRNWAYPGILALLLRLSVALGLDHPVAYRAVLAVPQLVLHAWGLRALHRWTRRYAPGGRSASLVTLAVGLQGLVLVYAGRTLGESLSVPLLWLALEAVDRAGADRSRMDRKAAWTGGLFLGLAVIARYASGAAVLGALIFLIARRSVARAGWVVAGGAVAALTLGLLDWATWGKPFHSALAYLRFNVLSPAAARQFGAAPPGYYAVPFLLATPVWVWPALVSLGRRALWPERPRWVALPLCVAGAYAAALLLAPHKEERFIYPLAQLLVFAAAPALAHLLAAVSHAKARVALVLAVLGTSLATFLAAPDVRGDQLRAIVQATRAPDATGLLIVNEGIWGAGGYFYVGKPIPWTTCDWPRDAIFQQAMRDPRINRAVTFEGRALPELEAAGFRTVGQVGRETILTREGR